MHEPGQSCCNRGESQSMRKMTDAVGLAIQFALPVLPIRGNLFLLVYPFRSEARNEVLS
jgi:hypothetical protein